MAKEEIYRSFEGFLNVDQQCGYILYSISDGAMIEYEWLSVWQDASTERARFPAKLLPPSEYSNGALLGELVVNCMDGVIEGGQYFHKDRWWSAETIHKIQNVNQDYCWQRYV